MTDIVGQEAKTAKISYFGQVREVQYHESKIYIFVIFLLAYVSKNNPKISVALK